MRDPSTIVMVNNSLAQGPDPEKETIPCKYIGTSLENNSQISRTESYPLPPQLTQGVGKHANSPEEAGNMALTIWMLGPLSVHAASASWCQLSETSALSLNEQMWSPQFHETSLFLHSPPELMSCMRRLTDSKIDKIRGWFGAGMFKDLNKLIADCQQYFHTIYLGIRSRRSGENDRWRFYWKMVYEYADVSMLHLLATFLESAPQLVLQLCIVVQTHTLQALQGLTAAASLVSLAWALASYQKALRDSRDDKKPISYMAVIIQFCWHFFTIAARVITFALFASVFQLYFGIFIVLHWCIMTFWIVHCETEFCITKWEEIVFDMVVGIIYIFSWFNVKEGRTRCRLFIYYFVILLENTALSALWYLYKAPQIADAFAIPALCVVFSSFLTGIVFMLMYYAFFHPNGPRFGQSPSCACEDPVAAFALPPEVATSTLRSISNNRSVASDRDQKFAERDGCVPVFQVRPTAPSTPSSRPPRIEESVIKIDLFRNRYPAWERHVLDRSLRKAILAFECSPAPPRLQYKDDALIQERLEYETTL
ncbi:XK-related protein 4 [Petaurus breviceps papuanus]|uniref:XK-related protein 4 n=1 Tax=Petaurus breviceps papuanus TaxID=3040969 RepID=UPI0036DD4165